MVKLNQQSNLELYVVYEYVAYECIWLLCADFKRLTDQQLLKYAGIVRLASPTVRIAKITKTRKF